MRKRDEFSDRQKAEIYVRDRALCCFSGKSLWMLDYGVAGGTPDWVDHVQAASKGGRAELDNGVCASWIYNKLKGASGGAMYLFVDGRPTEDFFTYFGEVSAELATHLRRFSRLHISDWYFNRAIFHVNLAAASHGSTRADGRPFSRGLDYWAKCASKYLLEWAKIAAKEKPGDLKARGLLPPEPSRDQQLLLELASPCTVVQPQIRQDGLSSSPS